MNQDTTSGKSHVLKWGVILAITIVLNLFFNYALSLFYQAPKYETFCPNSQIVSAPTTSKECVAGGGQWVENTYPADSEEIATKTATKPTTIVRGYCNQNYTCDKTYQTTRSTYERNVFVALVALGVISIIVAVFLKFAEAVSVGFSLGGVLSLVIASIRYWSEAQNLLRVGILALALCVLIWIGIKKIK